MSHIGALILRLEPYPGHGVEFDSTRHYDRTQTVAGSNPSGRILFIIESYSTKFCIL